MKRQSPVGGRCVAGSITLLVTGLLVVALLAVPAYAEIVDHQQIVMREDGSVAVVQRADEVPDPAPVSPVASIDDLDLVDAPEALIPLRNPTCNPIRVARLQPVIPDISTPRGCDPEPADPTADDDPTDPAAIARHAAAQLLANPGTIGTLPQRTITGLPTYYWLDGVGDRTTTRTQAGITLLIRATPTGYDWDFGDDTTLHGGPGTDGPPGVSEIAHTYTRSDRYQVSALVTWTVTFGLNGVTTQLPGAFTTTATTDLAVDQLRAVITH
jgi:hypothetical protein